MKQMSNTLNQKLFNAMGDKIDYTFYDRLELENAHGAIEREFFSIGIGHEDPITGNRKTIADTNQREGKVPEGQAYGIYALKFVYEATVVKTEAERVLQRNWIHSTVIEFKIETKNEYGIWKLSELLGFVDDSQVTAGAAGQAAEGSQGEYKGLKILSEPIFLPRLTDYKVNMNQQAASDAALDTDFLYCGLVGKKLRAG